MKAGLKLSLVKDKQSLMLDEGMLNHFWGAAVWPFLSCMPVVTAWSSLLLHVQLAM